MPSAPVVYTNTVLDDLMDGFETLGVVSADSMQSQTLAELLEMLATLLSRLSASQRTRVADMTLRLIPVLGEHVLTAPLDAAVVMLRRALAETGCATTAAALSVAHDEWSQSVGRFAPLSVQARLSHGRRPRPVAGTMTDGCQVCEAE